MYESKSDKFGIPGKYTNFGLIKYDKAYTIPFEIVCVLIFIFTGYARRQYKSQDKSSYYRQHIILAINVITLMDLVVNVMFTFWGYY